MATAETQVFISYHRADVDAAEQVRAHLAAHGVATWMDRYDIPAGAYWPDEIDQGLNRADFVVGLLSPDAVASRNVKNEWDWALQNGKQPDPVDDPAAASFRTATCRSTSSTPRATRRRLPLST